MSVHCAPSSLSIQSSETVQDLQQTSERRSANYMPTPWNSDFFKSLKTNDIVDEIQEQRAKKLMGEVKAMIGDTEENPLTKLELIDDIQRLGLSYHFEKDIKRALDRMFLSVNGTNVWADQTISVRATALCFRLCRQHGYEASQGLGCYDMAAPGNLDNLFDQLCVSDPYKREILTAYSKAIHDLGMDMCRKLLEGLGLSGDRFNGWPCQLRINKYNYTPQYVGSTGALLHTDPGFLTILQDDIGGLEAVRKETGEYVPVDPMPGSLVVNLGDLEVIWSNGRLWSVKHRVQCYEGSIRLSIAMFVLGPKDVALGAPEELVDSKHPRLYKPVNFEEYRMLRITTKSPTGAIELLRIMS